MTRNWKRQLLFKARIKWIKWIRKGIIWSPFKNLLQLLLLFSWDLQEERIQRTSCVRQVSVLLQTLASLSEKESGIQIREIDKVKGENQQKEKEKERRRNTWNTHNTSLDVRRYIIHSVEDVDVHGWRGFSFKRWSMKKCITSAFSWIVIDSSRPHTYTWKKTEEFSGRQRVEMNGLFTRRREGKKYSSTERKMTVEKHTLPLNLLAFDKLTWVISSHPFPLECICTSSCDPIERELKYSFENLLCSSILFILIILQGCFTL